MYDMKIMRNLKHFFLVLVLAFLLVFGGMRFLGAGVSVPITHYFVYRE